MIKINIIERLRDPGKDRRFPSIPDPREPKLTPEQVDRLLRSRDAGPPGDPMAVDWEYPWFDDTVTNKEE